jgi:hypothetical protein
LGEQKSPPRADDPGRAQTGINEMNHTAEAAGEQVGEKIQRVSLDQIESTADTQSRLAIDESTVNEYVEVLRSNPTEDPFPPVDLMSDGADYWIGDGWHRYFAYKRAGRPLIPAIIRVGTLRGARLFAAAANKSHGLKRTNADKRRAVEIIFSDEEWRDWSDRRIADHCGVSNQFVSNIRRQLSTVDSCGVSPAQLGESSSCDRGPGQLSTVDSCGEPSVPRKRVGKDGKSRALAQANSSPAKAPGVVDVPRLAAIYVAAVKDLNRIMRDFKAAAEKQSTGGHLAPKVQRIITDLTNAKITIRGVEPVAVCGKCNGKIGGCQHCARTGCWPRILIEGLKAGERLDAKNAKRSSR